MDFLNGEVLLFNKPYGWTSFQLVNKVRFIIKHKIKVKKIKVGHAGTLDPLATGLVIICTGRETKNIARYQEMFKEYHTTLKLGTTTPSFDLETEVDAYFSFEHITEEMVNSVLKEYLGETIQVPPVYSAKYINGIRAYDYARKGKNVKLSGKKIIINTLEMLRFDPPYISLRIVCSKGTYIRALARDIGKSLHSGAYMTSLERKKIGDYDIENAMTVEEFERNLVFL
ncbi:MAG: tRNA pseudouridine(55) synthase TruB [Bacteroidales bacterium]|nr:tRNA pseudouridine(55) synthase TruB [Bacteroidales bacterium]MBN2764040.1 tRNA pseudouridine(55) synthase TruB [Bacteroidales bacterium]